MPGAKEPPTVISFGQCEADLQSQELKKQGLHLRLSPQSFQILQVLLERPGELVTREELRRTLWPADTFVDFEHGLNAAVNRLRECLGDDAERPRYIETLPRRGYRLIAPVNGSRVVVERSEPVPPAGTQPAHTDSPEVVGTVKQKTWVTVAAVFAVLILFGAVSFGVYSLLYRPTPTPFQKFTITQVTNSGKAARAAISPDGRYVLSVLDDNGMESLWLRNLPTGSDTQVIAPSASHYESLTFSPDANYIYFRKTGNANDPCCNLYRAPMLGGALQAVVRNIDSDIAFSPDGQRIAYVRVNTPEADKYSILTASLAGDDEMVLQTGPLVSEKPLPYLAWSPKTNEISHSLYLLEQGIGSVSAIDTLSLHGGKSHRFVVFKNKFADEIHWSPDGDTLFAIYRQTGANWSRAQIGFLRRTGAEIERITRDTNRYRTLTLSADGRTLATVLTRTYASINVLSKVGRGFAQPRTLLSQSDQFDEWGWLNWTADGNLLVSNAGRLFKLGADGGDQTELLSDSGALIVKPSPCGTNYLVLTWTFHGGTNVPGIWRANADGSSPLKLTDGKYDFYPVCTPDQKWVYYLDFTDGHVYRVQLNGSGKREPILPQVAAIGGLSVSPDGKTLAAAVSGGTAEVPGEAARIALFDGSSSPPRLLPARHYADDMYGNGTLRFTPDGKSVAYVSREKGVDNVWVQPLDGSTGYPITDFKSEQIWSFSLSPDGTRLSILRGHYDSDVVLLQESNP
jgi:eukaryotic-like serine/threonine-protein kinase